MAAGRTDAGRRAALLAPPPGDERVHPGPGRSIQALLGPGRLSRARPGLADQAPNRPTINLVCREKGAEGEERLEEGRKGHGGRGGEGKRGGWVGWRGQGAGGGRSTGVLKGGGGGVVVARWGGGYIL